MTITTDRLPYGRPTASLYAADMVKRVLIGVQDMRARLRERIAALDLGEHTVVQRHGKVVGVFVPIEWYRRASDKLAEPTEF